MIKIIFYKTKDNKCPVEEFLDSLSDKQAQKVAWVLRTVRDFNPIPKQYFKKLINTEGLWEVRISSGNETFRLLGFFENNNFIVLTNGFKKKTQKTPRKEIKLAERRKYEFLSRRAKNG